MKKNNQIIRIATMVLTMFLVSGCAIIRPGEVGVKQRLGDLGTEIYNPGSVLINPLTTTMVIVPTRTMNLEVKIKLPSKEGLNVKSVISILYNIDQSRARDVIEHVGLQYEDILILSVFRSSASDVCAQFYAKDMHSGNRAVIEEKIKKSMEEVLNDYGFQVEAVLMKSINLPKVCIKPSKTNLRQSKMHSVWSLYSYKKSKRLNERRLKQQVFVTHTLF